MKSEKEIRAKIEELESLSEQIEKEQGDDNLDSADILTAVDALSWVLGENEDGLPPFEENP